MDQFFRDLVKKQFRRENPPLILPRPVTQVTARFVR